MFAGTWLEREMAWAIELHTAVLPYVEMGVGALLILGSFTTLGGLRRRPVAAEPACSAGLCSATRTMYPDMLVYLLVDAGILWLSPVTSNYLSIDGLLLGWFWAPRSEGEFRTRRRGRRAGPEHAEDSGLERPEISPARCRGGWSARG